MSLWDIMLESDMGKYVFGVVLFLIFFFCYDCVWKLIHGSRISYIERVDPQAVRFSVEGINKDIRRLELRIQDIDNRLLRLMEKQDAKAEELSQEIKDTVEDLEQWIDLNKALEILMKTFSPNDAIRKQYETTEEYKKIKAEIDLYKVVNGQ